MKKVLTCFFDCGKETPVKSGFSFLARLMREFFLASIVMEEKIEYITTDKGLSEEKEHIKIFLEKMYS